MKYFLDVVHAIITKIVNLFLRLRIKYREKQQAKKENYCRIYCVATLLLSLLGWLFPDALWDEYTVSIIDENGKETVCEYSGIELEEMITSAEHIEYKSKISEFVSGFFESEYNE